MVFITAALLGTFFSKTAVASHIPGASPLLVKTIQTGLSGLMGLLLAAITWPTFILAFAPISLVKRSVIVIIWLTVVSITWQLGNRFSPANIEAFNSSFISLIPMYVFGCCIPLAIFRLSGRWSFADRNRRENESQFSILSLITTTILVSLTCLFFRAEYAFAAICSIVFGIAVALISMPLNIYIMRANSPYIRWLICCVVAYLFVYSGFYLVFAANFTFPLIQYPAQFATGFAIFVVALLCLPVLARVGGWQLSQWEPSRQYKTSDSNALNTKSR